LARRVHDGNMSFMRLSPRTLWTVLAALVVLGGLVRLTTDHRRVDVALPEPADARAMLSR
jgi:hypothetical protein